MCGVNGTYSVTVGHVLLQWSRLAEYHSNIEVSLLRAGTIIMARGNDALGDMSIGTISRIVVGRRLIN